MCFMNKHELEQTITKKWQVPHWIKRSRKTEMLFSCKTYSNDGTCEQLLFGNAPLVSQIISAHTQRRYLEWRLSPCLPESAAFSSSCSFFCGGLRGRLFMCWSIAFCTGTGIRGNNVENHSSLVRKERSISPIDITHPPPAFTSNSWSQTQRGAKQLKLQSQTQAHSDMH